MNDITWFIIKDVGKESYGAVVYDKDGKFLWASSMMPTKEQAKSLLDDWTIKFEKEGGRKHQNER